MRVPYVFISLLLVTDLLRNVVSFPIRHTNENVLSSKSRFTHRSSRLEVVSGGNTDTATTKTQKTEENNITTNAVICGGGPAGILAAIMLAQKFPDRKVKVYDRLSAPPSPTDETVWGEVAKFYLLGLGGRGQTSLDKFGTWDDVKAVTTIVKGRKDWAPGSDEAVERIFEGRKFDTHVLPRDKLVSVLYNHAIDNYSDQIEINYGYEVRPIKFDHNDGKSVMVEVFKCQGDTESDLECEVGSAELVVANLLIAADGTARTIANQMEEEDKERIKSMNPIRRLFASKPFSVKRYEDDNQRVYKTIPLKLPEGWRPDLNYSARSAGGRVNLDALPATSTGDYCAVLLLRKDDELAQPNVDPAKLRNLMDELLPMFSEIIDDETVAQVAKKPPSFLPGFRYAGPRLNQGDCTLVLGDSAHTVKPYFGLGASSALEDVKILGDIIDSTDNLSDAVHEFSKSRAADSKTLVRISRSLDRPGKVGTITFIIPIILDAIFNKMAPKVFAPNIISMLQREDLTFRQVAAKKRFDRILQLSIIGSFMTGAVVGARKSIQLLANALGRRSSTVSAGIAASFIGVTLIRKFMKSFFVKGMAPADVLAQTKSKISKDEKIVSQKKEEVR